MLGSRLRLMSKAVNNIVCAIRDGRWYTVKEIANITELTPKYVHKVVRRMCRRNVIRVRVQAPRHYYSRPFGHPWPSQKPQQHEPGS